jgi:two-component system sensor histidine kinase PilS (NtrC family)
VLTLATNSAVFFLVALLATVLAQRLLRAHQALSLQQENLDDLQAFNALVLQSMGAGLVAIDKNGNITAFNRAAEEITGFDASEIIGQPFETLFGPDIHFPEIWKEASQAGSRQARRHETRVRRKDGQETPLGISFSPLLSGKGRLVGLIGICRDLTDIKRADRQVRIQDRLATVGRLAANIAHEIRNPLASLSGAIELLSRERTDDETRERLMEIVLRESDRLNQTIINFLEYARPDSLHLYPGNLAEILDEVLVLIERRPQLPHTLKIIREFPPDLPVLLDPQQVRQAFWNLCLNALDAMPDGGELRVGARQLQRSTGSWVEVWVSDTGQGIGNEDLPHIFEPFFTTKSQGSGLGLALVHRMVQDHGGEIEVKSEVGKGTTVLLVIPQESAVLTA